MDTKYIQELLAQDIKSLGCDIWGIEFFGKPKSQTLRIFIDNKEGISVEDCEKVSKHVIKVLDSENDFSNKYLLEISSPGVERKFFFAEQYSDYINCLVSVRFVNVSNKKQSVKGKLNKVTDAGISVDYTKEIIEIPFSSIIQANLIM